MKIFKSIRQYLHPCNLTIGIFDGIHIGHQLIFQKLKEKKEKVVVITFTNHPLEVLYSSKLNLIYSLDQKLELLKSYDIDVVVLLEFTKSFANLNYLDFLKLLKKNFLFRYLIVGEDFKLGKDRLGNKNKLKKLENTFQFKIELIKKIKYQNKTVSSSWIRSLIKEKNIALIEKLLNRTYKSHKE
jgi:riboflavin kinase/FMN adenylyltransferase